MKSLVKIKFIKEYAEKKIGDIVNCSKKSAESAVSNGYAEYIEEPTDNPQGDKRLKEIEIIKVTNRWKNAPKLNYEDLIARGYAPEIVEEFMKREGKTKETLGVQKEEKKKSFVDYTDEDLDNGDNDRFFNIKYSKKSGKIKSKKINIEFTARYLISKYNFKTIYGKKTEHILVYDKGMYTEGARGLIKSVCEKIFESYAKKSPVEEIFDKVKRKTKTTEEEFKRTDLNLIPLANCVYNIKKRVTEEHSPKNNFTFIIPVNFNKDATYINWEQFITETFYPEDIKVVQEWFGFNLFREYFIKKALLCLGKKDTGKSVFLDTLISFIGEKNKCGLSLQKISSGSDFTRFALKGKHSNVYDDLSSKDINDGGTFKVATGGGYISAEEKFGEFVQFKSFAKIILAGNKCPPVKDNDDDAYFDRYMPIRFDNIPEKIDPFLRSKLNTPKELSGILNWALIGLHRLLENSKFSYDKNPEEVQRIMESSSCPLLNFSDEVLEEFTGNIVTKEEMFQAYTNWAIKSKKPRLSKEQLGRQLGKYCKYILSEKHKERIWKNAKINSEFIEKTNLKGNQDTSDTISNFLRNIDKSNNNDNNNIYIKSENVSEEPPVLDLSKSGIKEAING